MSDYYKLTGTSNPLSDWTSEVVFERDSDGEPSKVISADQPSTLTKEEQTKLDNLGLTYEKVSKSEAEQLAEAAAQAEQRGADTAGAAPAVGETGVQSGGKSSDKSDK